MDDTVIDNLFEDFHAGTNKGNWPSVVRITRIFVRLGDGDHVNKSELRWYVSAPEHVVEQG